MKVRLMSSLLAVAIGFALTTSAKADPHCNTCPYDCSDLGLGHKDCSELERGRGNTCCVDLTQKGLRIAQEYDRVNNSNSHSNSHSDYDRNERCPAGFSPSERKCTQDERRRGCKDIRLPNGLGCVKR